MEDKLTKMNPEKRKALINAAFVEFGNNSYSKASTNNIVKKAGISKGLLYHYFKNKAELYDYLEYFLYANYSVDIVKHVDFSKSDLLERIFQTVEYKMKTFEEYPGILVFSKKFYSEKSIEELMAKIEQYAPNYYERFYSENIDYSLFKEGIDVKKGVQIAQWTLEKFSEQYVLEMEKLGKIDQEKMYKEFNEYLKLLRQLLYK